MEPDEPSAADEEFEEDPSAAYAKVPDWFTQSVPDHYADTVNASVGPYGLSLTFGVRAGAQGPVSKARVHMSHAMADVLRRLLHRVLTNFELENEYQVTVLPTVLRELKLTDEDLDELTKKRSDRFPGAP